MDASNSTVKRLSFLSALAILTFAPTAFSCAGDGTTLCRWQRTWNGPNSNWRPLSPYYVPRPADPCLYGGYAYGWNRSACQGVSYEAYHTDDSVEHDGGAAATYADLPSIQVGLERLGQIPNDLGISGGAATAPVSQRGS